MQICPNVSYRETVLRSDFLLAIFPQVEAIQDLSRRGSRSTILGMRDSSTILQQPVGGQEGDNAGCVGRLPDPAEAERGPCLLPLPVRQPRERAGGRAARATALTVIRRAANSAAATLVTWSRKAFAAE